MAFSERIRLIIDVASGNATSQLGQLRSEFAQADGAFAKMRVAGAGAFDFVRQNAALAVTAIGTSLVGFGAKAVSEFQQVALGAGELRDALGVTAEEASRFQEVAADIGVSTQALESAIGRMNRAAETTPAAFDAAGASIVRSADGAVDVTATFLSTADALSKIPDAAERAARGQEIFGRGWQQISELIMQGADGIRAAMAAVEEGKIIDDAEVARAREFRDAMDSLKGVTEELAIEVGGALVPALADAAENLGVFFDKMDGITESPAWAFLTGDYEFTNDNWGMGRAAVEARLAEDALDGLGERASWLETVFNNLQEQTREYWREQERRTREALRAAEDAQRIRDRFFAAPVDSNDWLRDLAEDSDIATEALKDLNGEFGTMESREGALRRVFDLGNAPLDAAAQLRDVRDGIDDLSEAAEGLDLSAGLDPANLNLDPLLDAFDGLRPQIQEQIGNAFSVGGPEAARVTAQGFVDNIYDELGGRVSKDDIAAALGISGGIDAFINVLVEQAELDKARAMLETLVGLGGATPLTAAIQLALDAGTITPAQAQTLVLNALSGQGVVLPTGIEAPSQEEVDAALAALTGEPATVTLEANPYSAQRTVDDMRGEIDESIATVTIEGATGPLADDAADERADIDNSSATVTVNGVIGTVPTAQGIANKVGTVKVAVDAYVRSWPRITGIRNWGP